MSFYVIVTSRSLCWTLLSVTTNLMMFIAFISGSWLIGKPRKASLKSNTIKSIERNESLTENVEEDFYSPSIGIFNRCTLIQDGDDHLKYNCAPFVFPFNQSTNAYPLIWKLCIICFVFAILLMMCASLMALVSFCLRSVRRKSIFTISGAVQAFAGLFYLLGLLLYPGGWGCRRVQLVCGNFAEPFLLGSCELGWASYLALVSGVAVFLCSFFSTKADISTSTDKIQDEILKGRRLVCVC